MAVELLGSGEGYRKNQGESRIREKAEVNREKKRGKSVVMIREVKIREGKKQTA
jgi:hypothetical protein